MTTSFGQICVVIWAEWQSHLGRMTTSFRQIYNLISAELWWFPAWECLVSLLVMNHSHCENPSSLTWLPLSPLNKRILGWWRFFESLPHPSLISQQPLPISSSVFRYLQGWTEGMKEKLGRDKNNLSCSESPLYKGLSKGDVRDERFFQAKTVYLVVI